MHLVFKRELLHPDYRTTIRRFQHEFIVLQTVNCPPALGDLPRLASAQGPWSWSWVSKVGLFTRSNVIFYTCIHCIEHVPSFDLINSRDLYLRTTTCSLFCLHHPCRQACCCSSFQPPLPHLPMPLYSTTLQPPGAHLVPPGPSHSHAIDSQRAAHPSH